MLTQPGRAARLTKARYLQEQAPPGLKRTFTTVLDSSFCQCRSRLASGARWGCPSFNQAPVLLLGSFPSAELAGSRGRTAPAGSDETGLVSTRVSFPARLEHRRVCRHRGSFFPSGGASSPVTLQGPQQCHSTLQPSLFPKCHHFCLSGQDSLSPPPPPKTWVSCTDVPICPSCRAACAPCPGDSCPYHHRHAETSLVLTCTISRSSIKHAGSGRSRPGIPKGPGSNLITLQMTSNHLSRSIPHSIQCSGSCGAERRKQMQNKSLGNDKPQICPTQVDKKQLRVSAGWLGLPSASQRGSRQILAARREVSSSPRCLSAPYRQAQTSCFGCEGCRVANPGSPRDGGSGGNGSEGSS